MKLPDESQIPQRDGDDGSYFMTEVVIEETTSG
jgi:hypothetical protein